MRRRAKAALAGFAIVALAAGCGAEDFENNPRPPAPIELTARVNDERVQVSPTKIDGEPVGAGLANFTISNQTPEFVSLTFTGPQDRTTPPIVPDGLLEFKVELIEGDYTVSTDNERIKEFEFEVGPERPSAQNDLLLP